MDAGSVVVAGIHVDDLGENRAAKAAGVVVAAASVTGDAGPVIVAGTCDAGSDVYPPFSQLPLGLGLVSRRSAGLIDNHLVDRLAKLLVLKAAAAIAFAICCTAVPWPGISPTSACAWCNTTS